MGRQIITIVVCLVPVLVGMLTPGEIWFRMVLAVVSIPVMFLLLAIYLQFRLAYFVGKHQQEPRPQAANDTSQVHRRLTDAIGNLSEALPKTRAPEAPAGMVDGRSVHADLSHVWLSKSTAETVWNALAQDEAVLDVALEAEKRGIRVWVYAQPDDETTSPAAAVDATMISSLVENGVIEFHRGRHNRYVLTQEGLEELEAKRETNEETAVRQDVRATPWQGLATDQRIFRAEMTDGCRDRVVIGGLAGFIEIFARGRSALAVGNMEPGVELGKRAQAAVGATSGGDLLQDLINMARERGLDTSALEAQLPKVVDPIHDAIADSAADRDPELHRLGTELLTLLWEYGNLNPVERAERLSRASGLVSTFQARQVPQTGNVQPTTPDLT